MRILKQVIFDRLILVVIYAAITLPVVIGTCLKTSFVVGGLAVGACVLCLVASSTFASCLLARRELNYSAKDLSGIATIAALLTFVGAVLMKRSGFWLILFGVQVSGLQWALVGSAVGLMSAKKELLK